VVPDWVVSRRVVVEGVQVRRWSWWSVSVGGRVHPVRGVGCLDLVERVRRGVPFVLAVVVDEGDWRERMLLLHSMDVTGGVVVVVDSAGMLPAVSVKRDPSLPCQTRTTPRSSTVVITPVDGSYCMVVRWMLLSLLLLQMFRLQLTVPRGKSREVM